MTKSTGKRFSISLSPDLERDLKEIQKTHYADSGMGEMVRDLIARGLDSLNAERRNKGETQEQSA